MELSENILLEILTKLKNLKDIQNFCNTSKKTFNTCKQNKKIIAKYILDIYQVDYTDPSNFIYLANKAVIDKENKYV